MIMIKIKKKKRKKKTMKNARIAAVNIRKMISEKINNFFVIVIKPKENIIGLTNFSRMTFKKNLFLL